MPIFDPVYVAERCPEGYQWVLKTFGDGYLVSSVYEGSFEFLGEHCSRWAAAPPDNAEEKFPGEITAGVITLTTPDGGLVFVYRGTFAFRGDLSIPEFTAKVQLRLRVDGAASTGVFEDLSGHGMLFIVGRTGVESGRLLVEFAD